MNYSVINLYSRVDISIKKENFKKLQKKLSYTFPNEIV